MQSRAPYETRLLGWLLAAVFLAGTIALASAAYAYHTRQRQLLTAQAAARLASVGRLKSEELSTWILERNRDATFLAKSPLFARAVADLLAAPHDAAQRAMMTDRLSLQVAPWAFETIAILRTSGEPLLSVSATTQPSAAFERPPRVFLDAAKKTDSYVFSDIYRSSRGQLCLDYLVPIHLPGKSSQPPIAVVLGRVNPNMFLYKRMRQWPTPTETGETVLVRQDGGFIVFLTGTRHRLRPPLTLRVPAASSRLPAAQAARGVRGVVNASDYRGVAVTAFLTKVPNSPWYLIAKVDQEEVAAPIRRQAVLTSVVVTALWAALAMPVGLLWRTEEVRARERVAAAELEGARLARRLDFLTRYANDIVFVFDADTRIVEANEAAVTAYGYPKPVLLTKRVSDLRGQTARGSLENDLRRVRLQGSSRYETTHRRADGTEFPVDIGVHFISVEDGEQLYQAIVRDITDQVRMREALKRTAQRLEAIIAASPIAIVALDLAGTVTVWNEAAEQIFGYSEEETLGQTLPFIDEDSRAEFRALLARVAAGESLRGVQIRHCRKDGSMLDLSLNTAPITDETGAVVGVIGLLEDITKRKAAERAVRRERDRAQTYLNVAAVMFVALAADGTVTMVNRRACQVLGLPEGDIVGKDWFEGFVPPGIRQDLRRTFDDLMAGRLARWDRDEYPVLSSDGRERLMSWSNTVLADEDGRVSGVLSSGEDITVRRWAEEALRASEERFRRLAENAPDIIYRFRLRPEPEVEYVSPAIADILGYPPEEHYEDAQLLLRIVHPDDLPLLQAALAYGATPPCPLRLTHKSGRLVWIELRSVPIRDESGALVAVEGVGRDVTAAEELEQQKSDFTSMISHELRTPLTIILGDAMLLQKKEIAADAERRARSVERILRRGQEMARLVEDLLNVSKIQAGKFRLELAQADVAALIEQSVAAVPMPPTHRLNVEVEDGLPPVRCDRVRLTYALVNLLRNAVKFSPGGGEVTLRACHGANGRLRVSVSDKGVGIPAAEQERIFDRYTQADMSATRAFGGFGLGLFITKTVVEAHAGTITVESTQGSGSTFTVELPLDGSEPNGT